jgi:hypothetical protein
VEAQLRLCRWPPECLPGTLWVSLSLHLEDYLPRRFSQTFATSQRLAINMTTRAGATQMIWSMKGQSTCVYLGLRLRRANDPFLSATGGASTTARRMATRAATTISATTTSRVFVAWRDEDVMSHNVVTTVVNCPSQTSCINGLVPKSRYVPVSLFRGGCPPIVKSS